MLWGSKPTAIKKGLFLQIINSWFSHDVNKTQTSELLILLSFYFHDVLEQLKLTLF